MSDENTILAQKLSQEALRKTVNTMKYRNSGIGARALRAAQEATVHADRAYDETNPAERASAHRTAYQHHNLARSECQAVIDNADEEQENIRQYDDDATNHPMWQKYEKLINLHEKLRDAHDKAMRAHWNASQSIVKENNEKKYLRMCAWCCRLLKDGTNQPTGEPIPKDKWKSLGQEISHGFCQECQEKELNFKEWIYNSI